MAEGLRRGSRGPANVARRDSQRHVRHAFGLLALALQCRDHVHGLQSTRKVCRDAVEKGLSSREALGILRPLDAEHTKDFVTDSQRYRNGFARVRVDAVEALVGHTPTQHDLLPTRRDPAGDPLPQGLSAS